MGRKWAGNGYIWRKTINMERKFFPAPKKTLDARNSGKSYYEMACQQCEGLFWPQRGNARFCNSNCSAQWHREAKACGLYVPKKAKEGAKVRTKDEIKASVRAKMEAKKNLQNEK